MALLPTPQSGRLLRWKADGTLENVTLADLLDQIAGQTQPNAATQKYWVDTSAALGANINAAAGAMLMAGYSPAVAAQIIAAITAGGASMALTAAVPGVATTTVSQFAVTLTGASMAMASGTPAVTATVALQLTGASMAMTAGTTTVSNVTTFAVTLTGASMAVTGATPTISAVNDQTAPSVGTLTVPDTTGTSITGISIGTTTDAVGVVKWMIKEAATDSFTAPVSGDSGWTSITSTTSWSSSSLTFTSTASATATRYFRLYACDAAGNVGASATDSAVITIGGAATSVSDNFNWSDGGLGTNWTTVTSASAPQIYSNAVAGGSGYRFAYWSADAFADNQYAEVKVLDNLNGATGNEFVGCAVRVSASAQTAYVAGIDNGDDGEAGWRVLKVWKAISGTWTRIDPGDLDLSGVSLPFVLRIEASGTTITVKTAATHGGSFTTRRTITSQSDIASGRSGIVASVPSGNTTGLLDDWYGGDL